VTPPSHPRDGFLVHAQALLEILVVALFVIGFLVQPSRVPSASMQPTLRIGDCYLVDKQSFTTTSFFLPPTTLHRGDLITFRYPVDPSVQLIKRVIALPGDHLRLHDGQVILNGLPLDEPYALYTSTNPNLFRDDFPSLRTADPNADPHWWAALRRDIVNNEIIVPPNQYFVMGDNRNDSVDSRYWGFVPRDAITGRPLFVYLPTAPPSSKLPTILHNIRILR
jgi:signal peptidase I